MRPPVKLACTLKIFLRFVLLKGGDWISKNTYLNIDICLLAIILDVSNVEYTTLVIDKILYNVLCEYVLNSLSNFKNYEET